MSNAVNFAAGAESGAVKTCGQNFSKDSGIISFIGEVDELNSRLGLIKAMLSSINKPQNSFLHDCQFIERIQKNLMKLMSHAYDEKNNEYFFSGDEAADLENETGRLADNIPKLTGFVLPGKNIMEAQIQIARTAARRAERSFFSVNGSLRQSGGEYLNKLSGYLFFLSQQEF